MKTNRIVLLACLALSLGSALFFLSALVLTDFGHASRNFAGNDPKMQNQIQSQRELEQKWFDWKNIENEYALFRETYMFRETAIAEFRSNLNALIENNRLSCKTIPYNLHETKIAKVKAYRVSLNVQGDYASIKKFIYDIEAQPHLIFLRHAQLSLIKDGVAGSLEMEVYFAQ